MAIVSATKIGNWVLLRNVHLGLTWLGSARQASSQLEGPTPDIRLFLTMETNSK
ncbi:hypothetical protein BGX23_012085, partial [Mortierella sp. AD031]